MFKPKNPLIVLFGGLVATAGLPALVLTVLHLF